MFDKQSRGDSLSENARADHSSRSTFVRIASVTAMIFLAVGLMTNVGRADLVFSLEQATPSGGASLPNGNASAGVFNILVRSTTASQLFLGADFTITLSSSTGAGGRMVSGSNELLKPGSNDAGFFAGSFAAPGAISANFSTIANSAVTLSTSNSLLAKVTLSTVGATDGTYSLSLSGLDAIDSGFNQIATSSAGNLSYTISSSAVPEPSSIALVSVVAGGMAYRLRRRKS